MGVFFDDSACCFEQKKIQSNLAKSYLPNEEQPYEQPINTLKTKPKIVYIQQKSKELGKSVFCKDFEDEFDEHNFTIDKATISFVNKVNNGTIPMDNEGSVSNTSFGVPIKNIIDESNSNNMSINNSQKSSNNL